MSKTDAQRNRELEQIQLALLQDRHNTALMSSLMCSLDYVWDDNIPTACTDGIRIWWSPTWWDKLTVEHRKTVMRHELEHTSRGHSLRMEDRDPWLWNTACDYAINPDLKAEGFDFTDLGGRMDDQYLGMAEEAIYTSLESDSSKVPKGSDKEDLHVLPTPSHEKHKAIARLEQAAAAARMAGAGSLPGVLELLIQNYRNPQVPWTTVLNEQLTSLGGRTYSYGRYNPRAGDFILPGSRQDEDRLANLNYYFDLSYSTSDKEVEQFVSEARAVWEEFGPEEMRMVCFDTSISMDRVINSDADFDKLTLVGRGGTDLECVREHILQTAPTCVVIFSDMECDPMGRIPADIEVIWVVVRNAHVTVPYGKVIHIN